MDDCATERNALVERVGDGAAAAGAGCVPGECAAKCGRASFAGSAIGSPRPSCDAQDGVGVEHNV